MAEGHGALMNHLGQSIATNAAEVVKTAKPVVQPVGEVLGSIGHSIAKDVGPYMPKEKNLWMVGVALALFGTLAGTVGKQMVRRSAQYQEEKQPRKAKWFLRVGVLLQMVLNPLADIAGYGLAPASVIAPVTGMDIVWNTIMAPWTLGETLTFRRLLSTVIIFVAATASVAFREVTDKEWTPAYVEGVLTSSRTIVYAVGFVGWYLWNLFVQSKYTGDRDPVRGLSLGATAGTLAGNMWCTKISAVLIEECIAGECACWHHWSSWICVVGAIFFAVSNLHYATKAMQEYDALFMVTVCMGANISTNSLSAIIVLGEMDEATWPQFIAYLLCIAMMMVGMFVLTNGEQEAQHTEMGEEFPDLEAGGAASPGSSAEGTSIEMRSLAC